MMSHMLTEEDRKAVKVELDRLSLLKDNAKKALEGGLLNSSQREACKKALPSIEKKIRELRERLIADRLLRDCDEYNIPKHYQDRPRANH